MSKLRNGKLNHGDRIEVYRNLHNDTFSIRRNGKVVKHLANWQSIFLKDVKFAVQPAGREKVRREGKKNVHAFIRGTYLAPSTFPHTTSEFKAKCTEWVTYNRTIILPLQLLTLKPLLPVTKMCMRPSW